MIGNDQKGSTLKLGVGFSLRIGDFWRKTRVWKDFDYQNSIPFKVAIYGYDLKFVPSKGTSRSVGFLPFFSLGLEKNPIKSQGCVKNYPILISGLTMASALLARKVMLVR